MLSKHSEVLQAAHMRAYRSFRFFAEAPLVDKTLAPTSVNQIRSFEANPASRS